MFEPALFFLDFHLYSLQLLVVAWAVQLLAQLFLAFQLFSSCWVLVALFLDEHLSPMFDLVNLADHPVNLANH